MALTETQIQDLYKFTRAHFVEHYDLQTELVDHLANGIEAQWKENPELTFKEARLREFRKFGVSGFEKVVRKRRQTMERRYLKIVLRFYSSYFRLPSFLLMVLLILALTAILFLLPEAYRFDTILGLLFVIPATVLFISFKNRNKNDLECVKFGKKWMLKDQIYNYGQYAGVFNLFPIVLNNSYFRKTISFENGYVVLMFAALIVCLGLLSYVTIFVIPKKAEELLAETYPEYKMVN